MPQEAACAGRMRLHCPPLQKRLAHFAAERPPRVNGGPKLSGDDDRLSRRRRAATLRHVGGSGTFAEHGRHWKHYGRGLSNCRGAGTQCSGRGRR